MSRFEQRRTETRERIDQIRGLIPGAEELIKGRACVYAIGSFGRLEAAKTSDLDLFIVGKDKHDDLKGSVKSALTELDAICVKADVIRALKTLKMKKVDADGRYFVHRSVSDLIQTLGKPEDDLENTFTARILLLLESTPVLGSGVYDEVVDKVIESYWRDFDDHSADFSPAFLVNDILRLWRTFCINYEARTSSGTAEERLERRLKNYKLKHSRLLTCFSAILALVHVQRTKSSVPREDAIRIVRMTPTARLEWLLSDPTISQAMHVIDRLLSLYEQFLQRAADEDKLRADLSGEGSVELDNQRYEFGDEMFEALSIIGSGTKLYRLTVV